ncbi:MAG: hypothetical protein Q8N94_06795 [Methanoregula sp.]|nr:hypothetical protein [Methanoregula sp.]
MCTPQPYKVVYVLSDVYTTLVAVDSFLMTGLVSILTQPRGERTDYHMLCTQ